MGPLRTPNRSSTYTSRAPASPAQPATPREGGGTIFRTEAAKKYRLAPADLDSILPVEIRRNNHGGPYPIKIYNISDVKALVARLAGKSPTYNPSTPTKESTGVVPKTPELAEKKPGGRIMRSTAMKRFKLKGPQLDRILPISIKPNPYQKSGGDMRFYNLRDVEELHASVQAGAASPSKPKGMPKYSYYDDDPFLYRDGIYDGMSSEDAAALFSAHTGIAPLWAFGDQSD
ncbi:hypothetical protein BDZ94DRAFT_1249947 [Collybia nuda]|uniref:Uncharacterized protein n=1 Tax=Collybia nuda TaxID=64659 RepID=A0A9P6CM12_9AGAR|nr:hypothetical protein BDZ94DRAFT_1249947 [Collybia nuda]